ncbi:MAG: hypothetical protein A2046_01050 [Bacteroidetes bacterium GWA2_30_7]|nr:MAG: hypothetical protein A2046_01050 [Bacteroidetes bacterium GWA2_30_7]
MNNFLKNILKNTLFLSKTLDFFENFLIPGEDYNIIACQSSEVVIKKYPQIYVDEVKKGIRTYTTSKRILEVLQSSEYDKYLYCKYIWTYQAYSWTNDLRHSGKIIFAIDYFLFLKLQNKLSQRKLLIEHSALLKENGKEIKSNLEDSTAFLKTKIFPKRELNYENLANYYDGAFVVCASDTNGGEGVFKVSNKTEYLLAINVIETPVIRTELFLENTIPMNQIAFITHDGQILKYKPSIQIIRDIHKQNKMEYAGCDFACENYINTPHETLTKISKLTHNIGEILYKIGYRGTFGCDFLVAVNNIHFIELNPRYQASTLIPNIHLCENEILAPHILHILGFVKPSIEHTLELERFSQENIYIDFIQKEKPIGFLNIYNEPIKNFRKPISNVKIENDLSKGYYLFNNSIIVNPFYPTKLNKNIK